MNLLDHNFFVFRNSDDDSLSIVYQRKAGGYGLIVTDEGGITRTILQGDRDKRSPAFSCRHLLPCLFHKDLIK